MAEQAAPDSIGRPNLLRLFKKRDPPLRPLRRETPLHPGDLVRIVRLVRTFLQKSVTDGEKHDRSPRFRSNIETSGRTYRNQGTDVSKPGDGRKVTFRLDDQSETGETYPKD